MYHIIETQSPASGKRSEKIARPVSSLVLPWVDAFGGTMIAKRTAQRSD
jgi:hypothetical protein